MRRADWRRMIFLVAAAPGPDGGEVLKQYLACYQSMLRRGHVRDTRDVLIESQCGSCGLARGPGHAVNVEKGLLSTHHPTAPTMKVCACPASSFSCLLM